MLSGLFAAAAGAAQDTDRRRTDRLTRASLWVLLTWAAVSGAVGAASRKGDRIAVLGSVLVSGVLTVGALGGQWLTRSGRIRAAAQYLVALLYVSFTLVAVMWGTTVFLLYALLVLTAGLVLGRGVAVLTATLSVVTGLFVVILQGSRAMPALPAVSAALHWTGDALALGWLAWLVSLEAGGQRADQTQPWRQQAEPESQNVQGDVHPRLEQLERQDRYLQLMASLSRDTAGLIDENELLSRCVDSIRDWFSLSQACIYLSDADGERLCQGACTRDDKASPLRERRPVAEPSSLVRRVLRSGNPAVGPAEEPVLGFGDRPTPHAIESEVALPLRIDGEVVGALDLHSREANGFDRDDLALLQMLADQVATLVRWTRAVSLLGGQAIRAGADRRSSVAEEWRQALQARRDLAFIRNERGLQRAQGTQLPEIASAAASGEVAFGGPERTVVAIPIRIRDQVIGVIGARKPAGAAPWSQREVVLVEAICAQVGQALENARLYETMRRKEERERLLGRATARMRESLDVETVLQVAADEIRHALGLAALDVRLEMGGETDG